MSDLWLDYIDPISTPWVTPNFNKPEIVPKRFMADYTSGRGTGRYAALLCSHCKQGLSWPYFLCRTCFMPGTTYLLCANCEACLESQRMHEPTHVWIKYKKDASGLRQRERH